jgi:hypothetical protein
MAPSGRKAAYVSPMLPIIRGQLWTAVDNARDISRRVRRRIVMLSVYRKIVQRDARGEPTYGLIEDTSFCIIRYFR